MKSCSLVGGRCSVFYEVVENVKRVCVAKDNLYYEGVFKKLKACMLPTSANLRVIHSLKVGIGCILW